MKCTLFLCVLLLAAASEAQIPSVIVLQPPASVEAFVAHTVRISCAAYGSPVPIGMSWTGPGGGNIASGGRLKIYTSLQTVNATGNPVLLVSTLEICGLTTTDSGQYNCTATDNGVSGGSVGSSAASTMLTVVDKAAAPPAMVVIPPATASVNLWDNMQLMCVAYGNPLPAITWSGGPSCTDLTDQSCNISANVTVQSTTVAFGDLWFAQSVLQFCSIEEEGLYYCSASNGLNGTGLAPASASISVTVISPPEPPTEPSPSPSSSTIQLIVPSSMQPKSSTQATRPPSSTTPSETVRPTMDTILGIESQTAYIIGMAILAVIAAGLLVVLVIECVVLWMKKSGNRKFDPTAVHMSNTDEGNATIG